jgi:hypothetical protein
MRMYEIVIPYTGVHENYNEKPYNYVTSKRF